MFKNRNQSALLALAAVTLTATGPSALALDQIIKPYQSVRSSGMGGLKLTTGLYDENFFGNPARVVENPKWKVGLLDPMAETSSSTLSNLSSLAGSGDTLTNLAGTSGKNNHARLQFTSPSVYINKGEGKWAFAFAMMTSLQADVNLRSSYQLNPTTIVDMGPAFTVGRTFFPDERLAVGLTTHATYRLATDSNFGMADLIQGRSLSPTQSGGEGAHLDLDLGSTYRLPWEWKDFVFDTGLAINNLLGGKYSNLSLSIAGTNASTIPQPRTFGFGVSARRPTWGKFNNTTFALEFQDIGNNTNGSLFRTLHLGGETNWKRLALRAGLNQGYLAAGLGIDLWALTLDVSTYGEEMTLNAGGLEDRRYAVKIGLQI